MELGDRVAFAAADVRDEDQVEAAVAAATQLGTLRVVVNCAGVATPGRVIGKRGVLPLETFRTVIDINLVGTFNVLRLAAAAMIDNEPLDGDRGLVIMTASVAAFDGQIGQAAYAASKGGIVGADPERGQRPCRQGNPSDDHRAGRHGDPDDGGAPR